MPATYRCAACNATWSEDQQPADCPRCGSPKFERWGPMDDPYRAPAASASDGGPVSSTAFSVLYWLGFAGFAAGSTIVVANHPPMHEGIAIASWGLIMASVACLLAAYVVSLVKVYLAWDLIQPLRKLDWSEADMPTPGMAVGLLFVPFFNLYWNFVALHGLTTRANKYMARSGVAARPMGEKQAQAYCILVICAIIPCVGVLLALANVVIYYLFILDVDRMRGAVQATQLGGPKLKFIDDLEGL